MLEVIPIVSDVKTGRFDLFAAITRSIEYCREDLRSGDILVISTKYASNSEGRILHLQDVRVSDSAMSLSRRFGVEMRTAEVILRESSHILGGIGGFVIATCAQFASAPPSFGLHNTTTTAAAATRRGSLRFSGGRGRTRDNGILAPNAGVDASNAKRGRIILYPDAPHETAEMIRRRALLDLGIHVGVILADSRLMPARTGTSGVAVACSGLRPVDDRRSMLDLDGNPLKVTFQATADNMASIANHVMGEGAESRPLAIVRGSGVQLTGGRAFQSASVVGPDECVYVRGLRAGI